MDAEDSPSEDDQNDEDEKTRASLPELTDMFSVGQYVRAVVSAVHPPGASDGSGISRSGDENSKASKRIELSLVPERVNAGVQQSDLKSGFVSKVVFVL